MGKTNTGIKRQILMLCGCLSLVACLVKNNPKSLATEDTQDTEDLVKVPPDVATGFFHTCALLNHGGVKCWGWNKYGQLGQGHKRDLGDGLDENGQSEMGDNLPTIDLGTHTGDGLGTALTAKSIMIGADHSCVILNNDQIKCWGHNNKGQLGQGHKKDLGDGLDGNGQSEMGDNLPAIDLGTHTGDGLGTALTAKAITAGGYYTCAILSNDQVKCWGNNSSGELGLGHERNLGDDDNEMGDNLPAIDLGTHTGDDLGTALTAKAIVANEIHVCVILDDDQVKCWGSNSQGQLGQGHNRNLGDDDNEMGNDIPIIDLGTHTGDGLGTTLTAKTIAVGLYHSCVILSNDQVKCWGDNSQGQLGQGHNRDLGNDNNEMGDHLPAIDLGTHTGDGLGTALTTKAITAGEEYTCAILSNDQVKCWGKNSAGELGLGHERNLGDNDNEMGNHLPIIDLGTHTGDGLGTSLTAKTIAAGGQHTCVLLNGGGIKCWGDNFNGTLGQGHRNSLGDGLDEKGQSEMGDYLQPIDLGSLISL